MSKFLNPKRRKNNIPENQFLEFLMTMRRVSKDCWEWTGGTFHSGYGMVRFKGKIWRVHRLIWTLKEGPIPGGKEICHTCDNPACFKPEHLFQGTHMENMRDALKKKRLKPPQGEASGNAKLTNAKVRSIRAMYSKRLGTHKQLAKRFGVSPTLICYVTTRKIWKHI